ncbi:MAG: transporter substrate-binding domain-containing protein [Bauldia sp.]|nr:transporter substrate-binding domain-containing protein [Bauldia sp.]
MRALAWFQALLAVLIVVGRTSSAGAQPAVPNEFLDNTNRQGGNRIDFCVNMTSPLAEFDRFVGQAIAEALLVEASFYEVDAPWAAEPLDYRIGLTESELFVILNNHCDAFLGFSLSPLSTPPWMRLSLPYLTTRFVLLATTEGVRFADLPEGAAIGTLLGTTADGDMRRYLSVTGPALRRLPYPNNLILLERLNENAIVAALVWEPAAWAYLRTHPSRAVAEVTGLPFTPLEIAFSLAIRSDDQFLLAAVDLAIDALMEDGTITAAAERLLNSN